MVTIGELKQGMKVRSSDGASLGKIMRMGSSSFLVEKGFLFPKDYWIPVASVSEIRDDEACLSLSREELQREQAAHPGEREEAEEHGTSASQHATPQGEQRMELSEEELEARKRIREAGEVTVKKEVVTEHRQVDVPVTKEEVHVERTPASAGSAPQGEPFKEETIRVPVREEEVEVTKKPRVREEVRVARTPRQEEQRVEGDVRREEARVERTGEAGAPRRDDEPER